MMNRPYNIYIAYAGLFFLFILYHLLQWPITGADTDLWYHLNSGRYIFENGSIPRDSYFSFIQPPREWVDYFWLFQAVVYKTYQLFDYYGLVFLRALIFSALAVFIFLFFFSRHTTERPYLLITAVFCLYVLFFIPRYHLIRPHMFTYLFVLIFLYILEFHREKSFLLPIIAVFWMNLHGVVYPLMLLIIFAYLIEVIYRIKREGRKIQKGDLHVIAPLIISICAVYATPHGTRLTWMPFVPTGFASLYIQELQPFVFSELFSFTFTKFCPSFPSMFNILLMLTAVFFIILVGTRSLRISHLILIIGGTVLLLKGTRFKYEFVLLAMPAMRTSFSMLSAGYVKKLLPRPVNIILIGFILLIPFLCVREIFGNSSRFPFSLRNLPHGVGMFLNKINTGGTVLNHPDRGGYHQWMLYPRYKIMMDMEVPFLFTNEDFYVVNNAFKNRLFLQRLIDRYDPSFITVSIKNTFIRDVMKSFRQYKIVFFDDCEVLYANQNKHPSVAAEYGITSFDPFALAQTSIASIKTLSDYSPMMKELLKISEIYPDNAIANNCLSVFYAREGKHEAAIGYIDNIIMNYPESATGYILKGDVLQEMGKLDPAIENYRMALKRWDVAEIYRKIGMVYYKQKRFGDAYGTLVKAMDVYSVETTYKDLYYLIDSAVRTGKKREAGILFRYAYQGIPPSDAEWLKRYRELAVVFGEKILQ